MSKIIYVIGSVYDRNTGKYCVNTHIRESTYKNIKNRRILPLLSLDHVLALKSSSWSRGGQLYSFATFPSRIEWVSHRRGVDVSDKRKYLAHAGIPTMFFPRLSSP
jgi:hypothetical protein